MRLVAAALNASELPPASAHEVERLDERAWALQEQTDSGKATQEQYRAAFRRARAAASARCLSDPELPWEEAVYEALHGLPEGFDWRPLVSD